MLKKYRKIRRKTAIGLVQSMNIGLNRDQNYTEMVNNISAQDMQ